jgi:hypothetical protein
MGLDVYIGGSDARLERRLHPVRTPLAPQRGRIRSKRNSLTTAPASTISAST